ncbi:MAG: hypothetical protein ACRDRA_09100 [Pseudonocardiaceae bacterium]
MAPPTLVRHLVLDNEAAQALASARARDRRRASVVTAIMAANGRVVVPTAVRVEAGWRRRDAAAAGANRLVSTDVPLDGVDADRAVQLRRLIPSASVVDATVVVAAERAATDVPCAVVEVLTSDVPDISALAAHVEASIAVISL